MTFKREERYFVIKFSDITDDEFQAIEEILENNSIPRRECVVVESDWPEYEGVWKSIEERSK